MYRLIVHKVVVVYNPGWAWGMNILEDEVYAEFKSEGEARRYARELLDLLRHLDPDRAASMVGGDPFYVEIRKGDTTIERWEV